MNYINNFIKVCLDIAEYYDNKGESYEVFDDEMTKKIGLGYRALTSYLRKGVQEVISLQADYHVVKERLKYEESTVAEQQEYLEDVFGDREPYGINDKDKQRIKEFCQSIFEEWNKGDNDNA